MHDRADLSCLFGYHIFEDSFLSETKAYIKTLSLSERFCSLKPWKKTIRIVMPCPSSQIYMSGNKAVMHPMVAAKLRNEMRNLNRQMA